MVRKADLLEVPQTINWPGKQNRKYFLDFLIKKYQLWNIAEVGVRDGRTTFFLLNNNPQLKIYAIDKSIKEFYNSEIKNRYGDRLIPIEQFSDKGHLDIPDKSLDLVFIDADHSYDWVKLDIKNYSPKLKSTGWLTGHDIDFPGVNKAVNENINNFDVGPNNVWIKKPKNIQTIL